MSPEPIWIPCEGTDCPVNLPNLHSGLCQMCGALVATNGNGTAFAHNRKDILAMVDRGDFGYAPAPRSE